MLQTLADAKTIAGAFVTARQNAQAIAVYPGNTPESLAEAFAIQDEAIAISNAPIAGWKVGRLNPPWLEKLGTARLPGPIFAANVQTASAAAKPTGTIFKNGFGAVEAEFIFRLGHVPESGKRTFSLAETAAMIDQVSIGIEIASSPFPGINTSGPLVTISDFGNNNGLIIGDAISDWGDTGLENWIIESWIDGEPVGQGQASAFPDGPLGSVKYLIENLVARAIALPAGLLISTGAVTGVHEINGGQHFKARFGDFGDIECTIEYATA